MKPIHIEATTISDAWFQLIYNIFDNSYKQRIQSGSFEGEYRRQYGGLSVHISHPWDDIVPQIPASLNVPPPTNMAYIEDYFAQYLMGSELAENETYTYGSRINEIVNPDAIYKAHDTQLDRVIEMLSKTPMTNQAVIEIAKPNDIETCVGNDGKLDPPCLRLIDFKVIPIYDPVSEQVIYYLSITVYFRSWDLWAGFPSNLGGLELLKQYVAQETGLANGPMYAYSAGGHIYGYQEQIAKVRTLRA